MKRLLLVLALLCLCLVPAFAQDATGEAEAEPTNQTVDVIGGEGEGNTIVNVGSETPVDETPETPTEPMPWWAQAGLTIAGLATAYVTLTTVVREAVKGFMSRPDSVASAENAVNLIRSLLPDMLEDAAAKGAKQAQEATRETIEELRKAFTALTDGVPEASKSKLAPYPSATGTDMSASYTQTSTTDVGGSKPANSGAFPPSGN